MGATLAERQQHRRERDEPYNDAVLAYRFKTIHTHTHTHTSTSPPVMFVYSRPERAPRTSSPARFNPRLCSSGSSELLEFTSPPTPTARLRGSPARSPRPADPAAGARTAGTRAAAARWRAESVRARGCRAGAEPPQLENLTAAAARAATLARERRAYVAGVAAAGARGCRRWAGGWRRAARGCRRTRRWAWRLTFTSALGCEGRNLTRPSTSVHQLRHRPRCQNRASTPAPPR